MLGLFGLGTCASLGVAIMAPEGAGVMSTAMASLAVGALSMLAFWVIHLERRANESRERIQGLEHHAFVADERALDAVVGRQKVEQDLRAELTRNAELHQELNDLREQLRRAEAGADLKFVEDLRDSRRDIEAARGDFLEFLEHSFFPVGERYEAFLAQCEQWDERVSRLLQSLDGSLATLGTEDGGPVLRVVLPVDPGETFGSEAGQGESRKIWRNLVKQFHSDTRPSFDLAWLNDAFDAIFLYVNAQWEALQEQEGARS
ncbi:MAG: hypothetical protein KDE27_21170 [Planctomycetes bacterium]|nr:hypothetical protein [Planctomycetota bacterium]